jgi:hypothetical protein
LSFLPPFCLYERALIPTYPLLLHNSSIPYSWASYLPGTKNLPSHYSQARLFCANMYLEPCNPPGTFAGWWFRLWENWVVRPAFVVLLMGLQFPYTTPVLLPASPTGSLNSVWWLAPSICICIGQLLAGHPQELLLLVPVCKHLLTTTTMLGLVSANMMYPQVGPFQIGPLFSLCSIIIIFCPCSSFGQEHFWVKKHWDGWVTLSLNQGTCLFTGSGLHKFFFCFLCGLQWKSSLLGPGSLMFIWCLETSSGYLQFHIPAATYFYSISRPYVTLSLLLQFLTHSHPVPSSTQAWSVCLPCLLSFYTAYGLYLTS